VNGDDSDVTFKTDVVAGAGRVIYLEGILTRHDLLDRGVVLRAFCALCRRLLRRYDTLCLLVAAENRRAYDFYRRVGFSPHEPMSVLRYGPRAATEEAGN
jgi:predicted GNAT family acetyltransferase